MSGSVVIGFSSIGGGKMHGNDNAYRPSHATRDLLHKLQI